MLRVIRTFAFRSCNILGKRNKRKVVNGTVNIKKLNVSLSLLTLTMPNFLNGLIHLTFSTLSIIMFRDVKMRT